MISTNSSRSLFSDSSAEHGTDRRRFGPVWSGFLHEFRNHITVLMGMTSELREALPPGLAKELDETVSESERNVQALTSLAAIVDASLRPAEPLIAPLGEVVDRAVRLAAPVAGRRTTIATQVPRDTGVRNRGTALEGLLAALIVDLARSHAGAGAERGPAPSVRLEGDADRRGLTLELSCEGAGLNPSSWRFALATQIADKLDASVTSCSKDAAYIVQLR
jgi:hypothetical protein